MADLDDFFAKKDKKRSKTSSKKFTTPEDLVKKIEDPTAKKTETKPRKEQPQQSQQFPRLDGTGEENPNSIEVHEDEWKEFEEEERKDYTGLKIGQLQINDDDHSGTDGDGGEDGDGENGDNGEKRKTGPWRKMNATSTSTSTSVSATTTATNVPEPQNQEKSKLYITPALRNQQALKPIRIRKGALPDINDEEYFPTLGATKVEEIKKKKNDAGFEEVKHGGRFQRSSDLPTNAPVTIGNRYNSLADS